MVSGGLDCIVADIAYIVILVLCVAPLVGARSCWLDVPGGRVLGNRLVTSTEVTAFVLVHAIHVWPSVDGLTMSAVSSKIGP